MSSALRIHSLELLGGHPVLDFVNTLDWRDRAAEAGGAEECLVSYDALVIWSERAGLIAKPERPALEAFGREHPSRAAAALDDVIQLREAIHRLLKAAKAGRAPGLEDLDQINRWLPSGRMVLSRRGGRFAWEKSPDAQPEPALLLRRLAQAAGELLVSGGIQRVGCCAGPGCGWLYLDTSPNRQRRWCSMQGCGNRAKAQRHYNRSKRRA